MTGSDAMLQFDLVMRDDAAIQDDFFSRARCLCSAWNTCCGGRDLPDHLMIFMLFMFLDTDVSSVRIRRVFFAMQQFGDPATASLATVPWT